MEDTIKSLVRSKLVASLKSQHAMVSEEEFEELVDMKVQEILTDIVEIYYHN